jgi:diguanylate cyclase (GGDEF)-like protein
VGLDEFQREIDRARRTHGSVVCVYVDVDRLKVVNDESAHAAGDRLLCAVGEGLQREMRSYDRVGGDESLDALTDVSLDAARARIDGLNAELAHGLTHGSFSAGLAELRDADALTDLIDRADLDLLAARRH